VVSNYNMRPIKAINTNPIAIPGPNIDLLLFDLNHLHLFFDTQKLINPWNLVIFVFEHLQLIYFDPFLIIGIIKGPAPAFPPGALTAPIILLSPFRLTSGKIGKIEVDIMKPNRPLVQSPLLKLK
jgi:hypothetical protein